MNQHTGTSYVTRFWQKVATGTPSECWEWLGTRHSRSPHGVLTRQRRKMFAHRVSWEIHNGPIADHLCVCHHCDNPPCVNPAHLFLGTQTDNLSDMTRKGRRKVTPLHGTDHGMAKLSDKDVYAIRARRDRRESGFVIAREYQVSRQLVYMIGLRQIWRHLPEIAA